MESNKTNRQEPPISMGDDLSFGLMFENHAAIMLLIEPETGLILDANPAAVKFYGYPKLKLRGMPVAEINCLSAEQVAVEREKAKNEGRNYIVMTQLLSNGQERTVEELSSNLVWQGKPVLFLIMHDITGSTQQHINSNLVLEEAARRREIILEDLRIHKIELEMQNLELCRSQEQLEALSARYFDLYDLAPVGYCTVSSEDVIIETNLTATRLFGVTRVDMLKKPFHRFIYADQQPAYFQVRRTLFETGHSQSLDVQMLKKDRSHFWAHLEATIRPDALENSKKGADRPIAAWIVISDISERKRAEQVQWENQELIFQNEEKAKRAAELVIANQELAFQNEEKAKRAAELMIANQELAFQYQEKTKRAAELETANQKLELAFAERENLLKDLRENQLELEFNNGELRKTQVELKSVRDRYVDLFDFAPVGYCTVNEKGLILETNLTAVTLLGVSRSQLINEPFAQFIFQEHQNNFYLAQRELNATHKSQALDLQIVKKDGSLFWAHLQISYGQFYDATTAVRVFNQRYY